MTLNEAGLELIKRNEGCRLQAYPDWVGVPTIGYGHTGSVKLGQSISQHQADIILLSDVGRVQDGITDLLKGITPTPNQFAACVSLAFNVGVTAFANSMLRKKMLQGDMLGAAEEFRRWNHAGGKESPVLTKRRAEEKALFLTP